MILTLPRGRLLDLTRRAAVMGILNVTPDSFSDGGLFDAYDTAVARALSMIEQGADIIDVGPESTRPGSSPVPADQQIARAVPAIQAIRQVHPTIPLSIDARLAPVVEAAIEAGADIVNDTGALRDDPRLADVVASSGVPIILMHRQGTPLDMQRGGGPTYEDVIESLITFFKAREAAAVASGIDPGQIVFDPGIGFGKRTEDNVRILRCLPQLVALGRPILVGASRKRFTGELLESGVGRSFGAAERDGASVAVAVLAVGSGASIVRVHDVDQTVQAVRVAEALGDELG